MKIDGWDYFDNAKSTAPFAEKVETAKRWLFDTTEWQQLSTRTPSIARIWLCYRLLDGALPLTDAAALIAAPVPEIPEAESRSRWECSWHAVRTWMAMLNDIEYPQRANKDREWVVTKPSCIINVMRTRALQAIIRMREGILDESFLNESLSLWRLGVAGLSQWIDILEHGRAMQGLHVIIMSCERAGIIKYHDWPALHRAALSAFCGSDYSNKSWRKAALLAMWPDATCRLDLGFLVPQGGTVAELGVARADFSAHLLRQHKQIGRLYAIDKWNDQIHTESEKNIACKALADERAVIVHQTFEEAAQSTQFENVEFDLIYIDGYAHTGQENGATLEQWWPKLKSGGIFAGHDYDPSWPLTVKTVDSFAAKHGLCINTIHERPYNSWWIKKPE